MRHSSTPASFPSATAWSTVLAARDKHSPDWKAKVESLVRRYWRPVHWYIVKVWKCSREDAADLTQEFFARLCEENLLKNATPERGRFRTFLRLELRNLVVDDLRRRKAQKRGGDVRLVPLHQPSDGSVLNLEWPGLSPEEQFDRVWAADFLSSALHDMEEAFKAQDREKVFKAFSLCALSRPGMSARECAEQLGVKVADVSHYVHRAREELRKILLGRVRESVEGEQNVGEELSFILKALQG